MKRPNFYSGAGFDRAGHRRKDAAWLAEALAAPATRFLPLWNARHLVEPGPEGPRPVLLGRDGLDPARLEADQLVLLGIEDGIAHFAVDLAVEAPFAHLVLPAGTAAEFEDLRTVGPLLGRREGALLAYAKGMLHWHGRHRFCGVCGSPTVSAEAGHVRVCTNETCRTTHFPRTDPAVIMLVTDGERALLGRQKQWPAGMYSTLAGFVEPGESLEEAVAREVFEEAGIVVDEAVYQSSQPWPFPASIMLGFRAVARTTGIVVDAREIQVARWYDRSWLRANRDGTEEFRLPRPDSIARRLIEEWLAEE